MNEQQDNTPSSTDALRTWVVHAGFSVRRRDAALAALTAFDAALRGDIDCGSPRADWCYDGTCSTCETPTSPTPNADETGASA